MKRLKIMFTTGVFVFAIVAAFATNSANEDAVTLGYIQNPGQCHLTNIPQECGTSFSNICTVNGITYYENKDAQNPTLCVDFLTKP